MWWFPVEESVDGFIEVFPSTRFCGGLQARGRRKSGRARRGRLVLAMMPFFGNASTLNMQAQASFLRKVVVLRGGVFFPVRA